MHFRVSVIAFLLICVSTIRSDTYSIWNPNVLREMFQNKTQVWGDYIKTKTSEFSDTVISYMDLAQKQNVTDYIYEKTTEIDDSVRKYVSSARDAGETFIKSISTVRDDRNNPDIELNTLQILARHGYPAEAHTVVTEDGYLLTLHRIPRGKKGDKGKRQPIFLQHGLLASSADWIIPGPEKALAYILADSGYDVWMGNVRGNTYSRAHVNISSNDEAFWNFSFHEVGVYDLPAAIDYIIDVTQTSGELIYVGHSMGTTVLFVMLSMRPEYNHKLKAGFALAPATFMSAVKSPIRLLAPFANDFEVVARFLGRGEFLPQNFVLKWLARFGCEINHIEEIICENSIFILCGYDEKQFNSTLLPVILNHTPAGASTKSVMHYAQEIHSKGRFQMYDYGDEENVKKYGSKVPPEYNLSNVSLPIALFSARNDWLTGISDAKKLYKVLVNPIEFYEVPFDDFNHLDFIWGIDAPTLVYEKLFELLKKYKMNDISWLIKKNSLKFSWNGNF